MNFLVQGIVSDETPIAILHHTFYKNDYVLSNVKVDGKKILFAKELLDKNNGTQKWVKINDNREEKQNELEQKIMELEEEKEKTNEKYEEKISYINKQIDDMKKKLDPVEE